MAGLEEVYPHLKTIEIRLKSKMKHVGNCYQQRSGSLPHPEHQREQPYMHAFSAATLLRPHIRAALFLLNECLASAEHVPRPGQSIASIWQTPDVWHLGATSEPKQGHPAHKRLTSCAKPTASENVCSLQATTSHTYATSLPTSAAPLCHVRAISTQPSDHTTVAMSLLCPWKRLLQRTWLVASPCHGRLRSIQNPQGRWRNLQTSLLVRSG